MGEFTMSKIYKYYGPSMVKKFMLDNTNIGIKLSSLDEFYDPYEFFSMANFDDVDDDGLMEHFLCEYLDIKESIAGWLASCFSSSPIIIPMWEHYGKKSEGFVLELDSDKLKAYIYQQHIKHFLENIKYSEHEDLLGYIGHHIMRGKHRGEDAVFQQAYFTKKPDWSYENEIRLLLPSSSAKIHNSIKIFPVKCDIVTAIIAGPKMEDALKLKLQTLAKTLSVGSYEMHFGRSTSDPFFVTTLIPYGETFVFENGQLEYCEDSCCECNEPTKGRQYPDHCLWCELEILKETRQRKLNLDYMDRQETWLEGPDDYEN